MNFDRWISLSSATIAAVALLLSIHQSRLEAESRLSRLEEAVKNNPRYVSATQPDDSIAKIIVGKWKGYYWCGENKNYVTLSINGRESFSALFEFYPGSETKIRTEGSFRLKGIYQEFDKRLYLNFNDWLSNPQAPNGHNLDLSVNAAAKELYGKLDNGCGMIRLAKTG